MQVRSDLTGFSDLLGRSFASRIDMLEQVLKSAHFPSLGTYKERLLAETIRAYLPKSVEVGTGFVMFPHEDLEPPGGIDHHDSLNKGAFTVSRQCDILVYDSTHYPVVFRDGEFVVVRPEATRAVIEVKGSISRNSLDEALSSFYDFGVKWKTTQQFYRDHHQGQTKYPFIGLMAWSLSRPSTNSVTRLRDRIAQFYSTKLALDELDAFPLLSNLYIYGQAEVSQTIYSAGAEIGSDMSLGWFSSRGSFVRFGADKKPYAGGDRTVAALLGALHVTTEWDNFNRFFSYTDITRRDDVLPSEHYGYSAAWDLRDVDGPFHRATLDK